MSVSSIEAKLFNKANRIIVQPVTTFPSSITTEKIDSAVQVHFNDFKYPFSLNHQLIIPIRCKNDFNFFAVFKITKIESNNQSCKAQFVFGDQTEVYLKLKTVIDERIPRELNQSLPNSFLFPRKYLFSSFPESQKLEAFLNSKSFNNFPLSTALIHGSFGSGKRTLMRKLADNLGIAFYSINLYKKKEETYNSNQKFGTLLQDKFDLYDTIILEGLELLDSSLKLRSIWSQISQNHPDRNLKLICLHSYLNSRSIPDYVIGSFDVVEMIKMPGTVAIKKLVGELFEFIPEASEIVTTDDFIGYKIEDFVDLIESYKDQKFENSRVEQESFDHSMFKKVFDKFKTKMKLQRSLRSNALEIPKVTWDQVAGLNEVKAILQDLITKLQKKPRPTGILLYGPPGSGKTLIAKALATQSRFALLPIKGPELLSPYIGESESSLRDVFNQARSMSPCIVFFDELDALVPSRGEFGDSVGVADRMVATFMTEMDKINGLNTNNSSDDDENDSCVFVIGATNRPDLIDPALMRKGRFDLSILLDAPKTVEERAAILEASCKNINCAKGIDFTAPFKIENNLSPAQIAAIASNASKMALERKLIHLSMNPTDQNLLIDPITTNDLINSALQLYNHH